MPSRLLPPNSHGTFNLPSDFPKHHLLCSLGLTSSVRPGLKEHLIFPSEGGGNVSVSISLYRSCGGESSRLAVQPQTSMQVQAQRAQIRLSVAFSQRLLAVFSLTLHRTTAEPTVTENLPLKTCLIPAPFFKEQDSKVTFLWLLATALVCFLLWARPSSSLLFAYCFVTFLFWLNSVSDPPRIKLLLICLCTYLSRNHSPLLNFTLPSALLSFPCCLYP